jgi:hypothetical protein
MFEKKSGMVMWREWRTAVWQRSPEIIIHRKCAAEGGRRNDGRKVSTQLPRPKSGRTDISLQRRLRRKKREHFGINVMC